MSLILFNGPPGSGKDEMALAIQRKRFDLLGKWRIDRMSMPIKLAFAGMTGTYSELNWFGINRKWEPIKDEPSPLLNGKSYRQWQIDFSEKFMKPLYGEDIFARLFADRNHERLLDPNYHLLVPDLGFDIELSTLRSAYPKLGILCVQIYRDGKDFSNDSRSYLDIDNTAYALSKQTVYNSGSLEELHEKALKIAHDWTASVR